jgi:hypothetical protein
VKAKASEVVTQARNGGYLGTPYSKLDCQAFVEKVLKDLGSLSTNWCGSNHMFREAVTNLTRIDASNIDFIVPAAWLFKHRFDGGEEERGYEDGLGNAYHVGLYLGNGVVMHSTTGGVQTTDISNGWTHYGLCKDIDYSEYTAVPDAPEGIPESKILEALLNGQIELTLEGETFIGIFEISSELKRKEDAE